MSLNALVTCSDEKIVRVLRRVLSDLEITIHQCADAEMAVRKLTRQRFEAVIVDCTDDAMAGQILRSVRTAPCNKHSVAVAIVDGQKALRGAFDLGAHFVLYKPISMERSKSSFRAARALMKRERRRNARVAVEIPVVLTPAPDQGQIRSITVDLGEGGMALKLAQRPKRTAGMRVQFTLPGSGYHVDCTGRIAWEGAGRQSGIRFTDISAEAHNQIKTWIKRHTPELEADDPPAPCRLTDLSLGGCYLQTASPLPLRTAVTLSMRTRDSELQVEGLVRVMHPDVGMGVEFSRHAPDQKERVEKFIHALANSGSALPDLTVEPEGLLSQEDVKTAEQAIDDPLLRLFSDQELTAETFQAELRKQRGVQADAATV